MMSKRHSATGTLSYVVLTEDKLRCGKNRRDVESLYTHEEHMARLKIIIVQYWSHDWETSKTK